MKGSGESLGRCKKNAPGSYQSNDFEIFKEQLFRWVMLNIFPLHTCTFDVECLISMGSGFSISAPSCVEIDLLKRKVNYGWATKAY
jgi:hypothetical protein